MRNKVLTGAFRHDELIDSLKGPFGRPTTLLCMIHVAGRPIILGFEPSLQLMLLFASAI